MDFKKYFEELKRRKVFKSAVAYLAVAWVLIQVASDVLPAFNTSPLVLKVLIILLMLGFPVILVFSWVYDVTPDGLKRTDQNSQKDAPSQVKRHRLNTVIIVFLSIAVILLLFNHFVPNRVINDEAGNAELSMNSTLKSIAVVPFEDISPNKDHDWLASGLVDAINNNLININGLRVIASRSVNLLVSHNTSSDSIADDLKLTHLLEGSVLQYENKIRINVKLISTDDYTQQWSKAFDQDMNSIYDIIDEVATSVGSELDFEFNPTKVSFPAAERTSSTEAYELFLKAKFEGSKTWGKYPPIVREYLEQAIKLDPEFYAAYAFLGFYWSTQHTWDGDWSINFKENIQRANNLFEFTIENSPSYGDAYLYLSANKIYYEQDMTAHSLAKKGFELNPSTFNKLNLINTSFAALGGNPEKNYELATEAMKESPYEPGSWAGKGLAEYFVGKNDDAVKTLEEGLSKFTEGNLYATAGRVFYALGRYEKVIKVLEEYFTEFPGSRPSRILGYLAAAHYKLGNSEEYELLMEELRKQAATSPIGSPSFHLSMVNAQMGDLETAFQWLNKAKEDKEVELFWLKVEPPFKPLYDDSRWQDILDELGFPKFPGET